MVKWCYDYKIKKLFFLSDKNHLGGGVCATTASSALDFDVTDFFVFGSSLGNVLAYRKIRVRCLDIFVDNLS